MPDDLFVSEDTRKPENRVNLSLFSMMQQAWFREWFLKRLGLPVDAVVYPSTGRGHLRPDLKVVRGESTLAWIEVELSKDQEQFDRYCRELDEPVRSVWGTRADKGDLSLEEVAEFLSHQPDLGPQETVNAEHLLRSIRVGLGLYSSSPRRGNVSDEVWEDPLVCGLRERLGCRLVRTTGNVPVGYLKADSTDSTENRGFSLRVNSRVAGGGTVSVMNITGGQPAVGFPSLDWLTKYLPDHRAEIAAYAAALDGLGLDIFSYEGRRRGALPHERVIDGLDELAPCLVALAGPPSGGHAFTFRQRHIGDRIVPTVSYTSERREDLHLEVRGEIVNEFTDNTQKKLEWKRQLASAVRGSRGEDPWAPGDTYAISLALRFHPGYHGGPTQDLDVENYVKPIVDAIAAGLFCDPQTDPFAIDRWDYDDSNFNTLLVHRLPDADLPEDEGVTVFVSVS